MIRPEALRDMLLLETAAANWYARMSPAERQTYIKSHPRSKYAKNGGGVLAGQAHALATKSHQKHLMHTNRANRGDGNSAMHGKIAALHGQAQDHYSKADEHFTNGDHKAGQKALMQGHKASEKALGMHKQFKSDRGDARAMNRASRDYHKSNPDVLGKGKKSRGAASRVGDGKGRRDAMGMTRGDVRKMAGVKSAPRKDAMGMTRSEVRKMASDPQRKAPNVTANKKKRPRD